MKKTYVLDTNVLLTDPSAIFSFEEHDVILPFTVFEELDKFKTRQDEIGANAREVTRELAQLIKHSTPGRLKTGIDTPNGGTIKVVSADGIKKTLPSELRPDKPDNVILSICLSFSGAVLVTNDLILRVLADSCGVKSEEYKKMSVAGSSATLYGGVKEMQVTKDDLQKLWQLSSSPEELSEHLSQLVPDCLPNEFVHIKNGSKNKPFVVRAMGDRFKFISEEFTIPKIKPRNTEQRLALELLMDNSVNLVSIIGKAGSGKTLMALAAGIEQVVDKKKYKSLIVLRPVQPLGKDIGFLPGPQPLDAKILTPNGWTTMGELQVGSEVIGRDGKSTKVLGIFPKGKKEVYKISTNDGLTTEACTDHLWQTQTWEEKKRNKPGKIRTTKDIIESLTVIKNGKIKFNHYLPRNEAVEFEPKNLPIPPYTLGVLLGDGYLGNSIGFTNIDEEIVERVRKEISAFDCKLAASTNSIHYYISRMHSDVGNKPGRPVLVHNSTTGELKKYSNVFTTSQALNIHKATLSDRCKREVEIDGIKFSFGKKEKTWNNPIKENCFNMGLLGLRAWEKFIPEEYLYSSISQRLDLLRGLMDTDGTIKKSGEASFTTTSKKLAEGIQELVRSLGGKVNLKTPRNRIGKEVSLNGRVISSKRVSYEFTVSMPKELNPFYTSRKAKNHSCHYIVNSKICSIESVGIKEVQCIMVENPEHLYITDDYIVTHNTIEEKMEPWIAPIKDNLRFLLTEESGGRKTKNTEQSLNYYFDNGIIEVEAMTYIRGRSIANAYMIIDEAQNLSAHELKTIITRVGEGTKIVLTGDIEQIDNIYVDSVSNGLAVAVEKFKPYSLAGHITLRKGERSELASLASTIL